MKPAEQKMNRKFVKIREQKGGMLSEIFQGVWGKFPQVIKKIEMGMLWCKCVV